MRRAMIALVGAAALVILSMSISAFASTACKECKLQTEGRFHGTYTCIFSEDHCDCNPDGESCVETSGCNGPDHICVYSE